MFQKRSYPWQLLCRCSLLEIYGKIGIVFAYWDLMKSCLTILLFLQKFCDKSEQLIWQSCIDLADMLRWLNARNLEWKGSPKYQKTSIIFPDFSSTRLLDRTGLPYGLHSLWLIFILLQASLAQSLNNAFLVGFIMTHRPALRRAAIYRSMSDLFL